MMDEMEDDKKIRINLKRRMKGEEDDESER